MTPEKLAESKAAVDLYKRQQARREQGLPDDDASLLTDAERRALMTPEERAMLAELEGEGEEEEDELEAAFDKWITRIAAGVGVLVLVVAIVIGVHNTWVHGSLAAPPRDGTAAPSAAAT